MRAEPLERGSTLQSGYDRMDESDESIHVVDDEFAEIEADIEGELKGQDLIIAAAAVEAPEGLSAPVIGAGDITAATNAIADLKLPINLGYVGFGIGLLAIFLFLNASNITGEWECSTKTYEFADGTSEEYTCETDYTLFDAPSTKIRCFSCFILVPLGILLSLAGREQSQRSDVAKLNYVADEAATGYVTVNLSENEDKTSVTSFISSAGIGLNIALLILGILAVIGIILMLVVIVFTWSPW